MHRPRTLVIGDAVTFRDPPRSSDPAPHVYRAWLESNKAATEAAVRRRRAERICRQLRAANADHFEISRAARAALSARIAHAEALADAASAAVRLALALRSPGTLGATPLPRVQRETGTA